MNSTFIHAGDTMDPDEVKVPKPPYYWVDPSPNTEKGGGLPSTKCTTQADGLASPTSLYFYMEHKEANTSFVVSHMAASQFRQIKTMLQFSHMGGGIVFAKGGRRG